MSYAITNITDQPAEISFKKLESDSSFDYITTDIILKTKLNKILKINNDKLKVEGLLDDDKNKLYLITEQGNIDEVIVNSKNYLQYESNFRNIIKTKFGIKENDIYSNDYVLKAIPDRFNYAEKAVIFDNKIVWLDYYHKKIQIYDLEGIRVKTIDAYNAFKYTYNIFDDNENIYLTCSKYNDKIIVVPKRTFLDIDTLDESNTTFLELNVDNIDTDNFILSKVYRNDFVIYKNNILFSIENKGIYYCSLDMKEVYCLSDDIDYKSRTPYTFQLVNDEIYIIAGGNAKVIYKLNYDGTNFELNTYMTHNRYMDTLSKSFIVVNDKIFDYVRNQVIDITNKTFKPLDRFARRLPNFRACPFIYNGKLIYHYSRNIYFIDLDLDKIDLYNQTEMILDKVIDKLYTHCTFDIDLKYYIDDIDYSDKLVEREANIKSELISSKYVIALPEEKTEINQKITIGKNRVNADKFITYLYKKR